MLPLVTDASGSGIDLVGEGRIRAVELIGVDPDDGSILFVHAGDDLAISSDEPPVIVCFVEVRCRGDFWSGEPSEWMKRRDVV